MFFKQKLTKSLAIEYLT